MANYLDETGLLKLWSKIKSYAAKQIDMNKAIVNISASGTTLTVTKADGTTKYVTAINLIFAVTAAINHLPFY